MKGKVIRVVSLVAAVALALAIAFLMGQGSDNTSDTASISAPTMARPGTNTARTVGVTSAIAESSTERVPGVPTQAYSTLTEIDAGRWPGSANAPGTKGGERWQNREGRLPSKDDVGRPITYQEWDVNPKKRGQSRDAERIVTGSDGTAWYTGDHYGSFIRMR